MYLSAFRLELSFHLLFYLFYFFICIFLGLLYLCKCVFYFVVFCVFVYFTLWQSGAKFLSEYWGQTRCVASSANPANHDNTEWLTVYALLWCVPYCNTDVVCRGKGRGCSTNTSATLLLINGLILLSHSFTALPCPNGLRKVFQL